MTAAKLNLTANEQAAIKAFFDSEYHSSDVTMANKANFTDGGTWTFSVSDHFPGTPRSYSGVASSMVKKGLFNVSEGSKGEPNSAGTTLTDLGWFAAIALGYVTDATPAQLAVAEATLRSKGLMEAAKFLSADDSAKLLDEVLGDKPTPATKVVTSAAPVTPVVTASGKVKVNWSFTGYNADNSVAFYKEFMSVSSLNVMINAEDFFKKKGVDIDTAAARIEIKRV
jgi:hypothetical protein